MNQNKLRLAFAGTPDMSAFVLESLLKQQAISVDLIITQPDKPSGRGRAISKSPVKTIAETRQIPVIQPTDPTGFINEKRLAEIDVMVVIAYGMLLPENILNIPKFGCLNIHTSLLPRWRGAAPIQRAIQAGDTETGISIMQIDAGLDTGPILAQRRCEITSCDTTESLGKKLSQIGAECLIDTLLKLNNEEVNSRKQDESQATYAYKITKQEAEIDWQKPAWELERMIRAFIPWPVAFTKINGYEFRIWQAEVIDKSIEVLPGELITCNTSGIDIATGEGLLRILRLQPVGKKQMSVSEFLNGRPEFVKS